ncbi:MAG TPA: hypothetical protein VFU99_02305 [Gaiellaceae bacterium]|nr:hypothetical protein [Gaiellaceae bacterium]
MAGEQRTDADIRNEISAERERLADALADLRAGVDSKRRLAGALGTLVAAGLATAASMRIARRVRGR